MFCRVLRNSIPLVQGRAVIGQYTSDVTREPLAPRLQIWRARSSPPPGSHVPVVVRSSVVQNQYKSLRLGSGQCPNPDLHIWSWPVGTSQLWLRIWACLIQNSMYRNNGTQWEIHNSPYMGIKGTQTDGWNGYSDTGIAQPGGKGHGSLTSIATDSVHYSQAPV